MLLMLLLLLLMLLLSYVFHVDYVVVCICVVISGSKCAIFSMCVYVDDVRVIDVIAVEHMIFLVLFIMLLLLLL